jgi:alpha-ketoglutarate-dependent taurine dioxygenase
MGSQTQTDLKTHSRRTPVTGASAWYGRDLESKRDWIESFTVDEARALLKGLDAVRARALEPEQIRRCDFDTPLLRQRFLDVGRTLERGRGFVIFRGFPLDELSDKDCKLLFWGLAMQLGVPVSQNRHLHLIAEVKDVGEKMGQATSRAYRSRGPLRFHTDQCDVLGLMCLRGAVSGGHSRFVSSAALYNEVLAQRPDYLDSLCQPYCFSRQGEEVPGAQRWYERPVFDTNDGSFTSMFSRTYIESAQKIDGVPALSAERQAALEFITKLADEHCVAVELQRGDIQFFNCHVTYHARSAFDDHDEADKKRTLLRLWLSVPNSRPLPEYVAPVWGSVGPGSLRGGHLHVTGRRSAFPDWEAAGWDKESLNAWRSAAR